MSAEFWFYHLERSELEAALPPLIEKCLAKGWRALIRSGAEARLDVLDAALWTFRDDSFVPHGREEAGAQPAFLTSAAGNPNGAQALFLVDGAAPGVVDGFERVSLMFDGRDAAALAAARQTWKDAKAAGHAAS
jgi:DNA polymerase III subunit chi